MSSKLVWIAGPHAWEDPKPLDELVAKLASMGIGRLCLLTDGAPGTSKHVQESAIARSVHVLEMRARWETHNHTAGEVRDLFLAQTLPIDMLVAVTYLPDAALNHREVRSAIDVARGQGIPVKRMRVKPEEAMPSLESNSAPGAKRRKAQAKKSSH